MDELEGVVEDKGSDAPDHALPDIVKPAQDDQAPLDVPEPEVPTTKPTIINQPEPQLVEQQQPPNAAVPIEANVLQPDAPRRSTHVRRQAQQYVPSMQGNRYQYAAAQLANGVLYPDAHRYVQDDFYQYRYIVETVMN